MAYIISQADVENVAGTSNVAVWSNLENDSTTADTDRITAGINWAESVIESRLYGKYAVPLQSLSGTFPYDLKDVAAKLAASWLHSSRRIREGEDSTSVGGGWRREAEEIMDLWMAGTRRLACRRAEDRVVSVPRVFI